MKKGKFSTSNKRERIHLSTSSVDANEVYPYILDSINRNQVTSFGENINSFERELSKYLGDSTEVVCTNSGTSAIHLALMLSDVGPNDEVLCQTMTFCATVNPIIYQRATPVFVDSERDTWNMCPNNLKTTIENRIKKGKKPKAIIVVHSYGMPAQIDKIKDISRGYKITLIEDAAEALGSKFKGQHCGTFGDYGVLSFNGNKIITTSSGGALICKTQKDKERAIFLATQSKDDEKHYQHSEIGYNYRMSNIAAGIGCAQMKVLEEYIALRRKNNEFYKELFSDIKGIKVLSEPTKDFFSNHWLSCIVLDTPCETSREEMMQALDKANIETRPLWKPMHLQPVFRTMPYGGGTVSENVFNKGLCLPSGSNLSNFHRERIQRTINNVLKKLI